MIRCNSCGKENLDASRFCSECGVKLAESPLQEAPANGISPVDVASSTVERPPDVSVSGQITSVGIPEPAAADAFPEPETQKEAVSFPEHGAQVEPKFGPATHARLIIERGASASMEFQLSAEESYIGRWDADNGIFPDVDLDAHDPDAKVSRRHARVTFRGNVHMIEDLGSTNGTFINRGRRLLPGTPQVLTEGDEIIVGKTFLRFHINR